LTINLTVFLLAAHSARTLRALRCAEPDTLDSKKYSIIKDRWTAETYSDGSSYPPVLGWAAHEGHFYFHFEQRSRVA
jgi:hypothetical protein